MHGTHGQVNDLTTSKKLDLLGQSDMVFCAMAQTIVISLSPVKQSIFPKKCCSFESCLFLATCDCVRVLQETCLNQNQFNKVSEVSSRCPYM